MKNYIIPKNEKRFGVDLSTGVIRCISEPEDFFDAEQDLSISLIADEKMYKNFKYTKTVDGKPEFVLLNNKIIVEYIYKSDDCSENAFAEIFFENGKIISVKTKTGFLLTAEYNEGKQKSISLFNKSKRILEINYFPEGTEFEIKDYTQQNFCTYKTERSTMSNEGKKAYDREKKGKFQDTRCTEITKYRGDEKNSPVTVAKYNFEEKNGKKIYSVSYGVDNDLKKTAFDFRYCENVYPEKAEKCKADIAGSAKKTRKNSRNVQTFETGMLCKEITEEDSDGNEKTVVQSYNGNLLIVSSSFSNFENDGGFVLKRHWFGKNPEYTDYRSALNGKKLIVSSYGIDEDGVYFLRNNGTSSFFYDKSGSLVREENKFFGSTVYLSYDESGKIRNKKVKTENKSNLICLLNSCGIYNSNFYKDTVVTPNSGYSSNEVVAPNTSYFPDSSDKYHYYNVTNRNSKIDIYNRPSSEKSMGDNVAIRDNVCNSNGTLKSWFGASVKTVQVSDKTLSYITYIQENSGRVLRENTVYSDEGELSKYRNMKVRLSADKLISAFGNNRYSYNAFGKRTEKNEVKYFYDSGRLLSEKNGNKIIHYIYGSNGIIGFSYEGEYYFYRKNLFMDVTGIILYDTRSMTSVTVAEYVYDCTGCFAVTDGKDNIVSDPDFIGNINPIRFRGMYYDTETGFYYDWGKYYDPMTGRYIIPIEKSEKI